MSAHRRAPSRRRWPSSSPSGDFLGERNLSPGSIGGVEIQPTGDQLHLEPGGPVVIQVQGGIRPDSDSVLDGVALGPDGALWVRRPTGVDRAEVDVFDPSGHYLGTLGEPSVLPAAFLSSDSVVLVREDTLGVERVEVAHVERTG